jgi:ER-bound oxygenase mpaB/B'/Rubber oxygenase, catalytic domain
MPPTHNDRGLYGAAMNAIADQAARETGPTSRTPTDFRYWQAAQAPKIRRIRAAAERLLGFDLCPPDEAMRQFIGDMWAGDPVAERFVDEVFFGAMGPRKGRQLLDQALVEGVDSLPDPPASMQALFHQFEQVPSWVDRELVEEGARIWRRWGTDLFAVAGAGTLEMYTESAVATPLSLAGGYAGDNALRRFLETTRFWMDVSEPGALFQQGGAGRGTAMRVRVMHVSVRRRVAQHAEWDMDRWGLPISQAYMMLTLLGGSVAPALVMWGLGHITTGREMRALLHYQRYLGHLVGVFPACYPDTIAGAVQLVYAVAIARSYTSGPHGAELIESFPKAFVPAPGLRGRAKLAAQYNSLLIDGLVNYLMAPGTRKRYELPSPLPGMLLVAGRAPLIAAAELAGHLSPAIARQLEARAVRRREAWYALQMDGREAAFEAQSQLRR